ncbi:Peroxisomal membrane protein PEX16 [Exophiala dermatitidis]|uniref:Peroxisomal membrane protein PEX16 n=2 Tax=Exophiala dermatitidis TaxID=5970 RepID=H6CC22_EXODN|nr:uncharacterized protein HMPREF1120_09253 [Exophiala dermatitidis NIH/UT8656]EHY61319.1 hypothetical protein HMPREF1120_09253 [Exophiala dermatitidis NIH/UT8656]
MASSGLRRTVHATMSGLSTVSADLARAAINLPSSYSDYVASNTSSVSSVETSLRSLTYLLPGTKYHDSELASEAVHTSVQLLSIYHDHLLRNRAALAALSPTAIKAGNGKGQRPKLSLHARYTMFWSSTFPLYTKIATLLKIAQYTELLWEMIARRRGGERTRWRVVVLLETFKAVCRLLLMRLTGSRPLVSPPMPLREDFAPVGSEDEEEMSEEELKVTQDGDSFDVKGVLGNAGVLTPPLSDAGKPTSSLSTTEPYTMPRTGFTLPSLPTPDAVSSYLLRHVLTADDVKPAKELLHKLATLRGQAAEVMYILRPVVYALLMQRVARTYGYEGSKWKRQWTPWLMGITIEYLARQLAKQDLVSRVPGGSRTGLSALEREELRKRGWQLAWWGMRGAFYENITKKWVHGVAAALKGKPILDLVAGVVDEYEFLWSNYYFSTSTL